MHAQNIACYKLKTYQDLFYCSFNPCYRLDWKKMTLFFKANVNSKLFESFIHENRQIIVHCGNSCLILRIKLYEKKIVRVNRPQLGMHALLHLLASLRKYVEPSTRQTLSLRCMKKAGLVLYLSSPVVAAVFERTDSCDKNFALVDF